MFMYYGLPLDIVKEAVLQIESSLATQEYLRRVIVKQTNMFTKLPLYKIQIMELRTGIRIEEANIIEERNSKKRQKRALIAFFALHPWLGVDSQKPYESILQWLQIYAEIAQVKPGEPNSGKTLVIRGDGTMEIE